MFINSAAPIAIFMSSAFLACMTERTTVRLEPELLRAAKKKAAEDGRTLTSLVEEGLRNVLRGEKPKQKKPIRLPVSKETGGMILPPHIDPNKTSEVLEYLDSFLPPEKRR